MGISVPPTIKEVKENSGETILTESHYQNMFQGCIGLTQAPEMPDVLKTPVMSPMLVIPELVSPTSEPLSADGFDWRENERNAYEL